MTNDIKCPNCGHLFDVENVIAADLEKKLETKYQNKLQHISHLPERRYFVCDECCRPLHLYGENFIETYTNGKVNTLRCLCDIHADEMEVNA